MDAANTQASPPQSANVSARLSQPRIQLFVAGLSQRRCCNRAQKQHSAVGQQQIETTSAKQHAGEHGPAPREAAWQVRPCCRPAGYTHNPGTTFPWRHAAPPEISDVVGKERIVEVLQKAEPQHPPKANGHVGVGGNISNDAPALTTIIYI